MGMVNYLLVAGTDEAEAIAAHDDPSQMWNGFHCQGLNSIKLVALWALIDGGSVMDRFEQRMESVQSVLAGENGPWVDVTSAGMLSALSSVAAMEDDEIRPLASSLCGMEDFGDWNESDVVDLIRSIGDHAETAVLERKTIMVYTSF